MAAMAVSWCTDAPKIFLTFDKFDRQVMGRGFFGTYGGHNTGNALTLMKGHLEWSTRGFQRPTRDGSIQGQALQDPARVNPRVVLGHLGSTSLCLQPHLVISVEGLVMVGPLILGF